MKTGNKLLFVLGVGVLLASCTPGHTHTPDTEWHTDATQHWHLCTDCGEKVGASNHVYNQEVVDATYLAATASCTEGAKYYKSCECGAFDNSAEAATFTSGTALGHSYGDAYIESNPSKVAYEVGDTFDWTNVVIKHACTRTGCEHTETIENSKFTVNYTNGGSSFAFGESQVTLTSNDYNTLTITGLSVAKKANAITGVSSIGYATTCKVAPTITGLSATSGEEVTYAIYAANDSEHTTPIAADEVEAGDYVIVFTSEATDAYVAATATAALTVTHKYEVVDQDAATVKDAGSCTEVATYWKQCACGTDATDEADTFEGAEAVGHLFTTSSVTITSQPTKKAYDALEEFDLTGMTGTLTCKREGCNHVEDIDMSKVSVTYQNGECLHGEDTAITLTLEGVGEMEATFESLGVTVSKLANTISGLEASYITTCKVAPTVGTLTATNGTPTVTYKNGEAAVALTDLVKGSYTLVASVAESEDYEAAEATATLTVNHNDADTCTCGTVLRQAFTLPTTHKVALDLSADTVIDLAAMGLDTTKTYTSAKVMIGATEVAATISEGKLTVDEAALPAELTVGEHSDIKFVAVAGDYTATFSGSVIVATKILKTVNDVKQNCSVIKRTGADSFSTNFGDGEYFVLGNDLDGTSTWFYGAASADKSIFHSSTTGESWDCKYGFHGTFDGNNYSICGGTTVGSTFGIFCGLGENSVVKNINIYNVAYSGEANECIFGKIIGGCTFSNVFIEVRSSLAAAQADVDGKGILGCSWANKNVIDHMTVIIRNTDGSAMGNGGNVIRQLSNNPTASNSAFCGNVINPNVPNLTLVNWALDSIDQSLTFVWKAAENMYRILMHDGSNTAGYYNRILVNGKVVPDAGIDLWISGNKTVIDIKGEYMNPGDVIYVCKEANGNAARGIAPAKA